MERIGSFDAIHAKERPITKQTLGKIHKNLGGLIAKSSAPYTRGDSPVSDEYELSSQSETIGGVVRFSTEHGRLVPELIEIVAYNEAGQEAMATVFSDTGQKDLSPAPKVGFSSPEGKPIGHVAFRKMTEDGVLSGLIAVSENVVQMYADFQVPPGAESQEFHKFAQELGVGKLWTHYVSNSAAGNSLAVEHQMTLGTANDFANSLQRLQNRVP